MTTREIRATFAAFAALSAVLAACSSVDESSPTPTPTPPPSTSEAPPSQDESGAPTTSAEPTSAEPTTVEPTSATPDPDPDYITIVSGGDILPHLSVVDSAAVGGTYDFAPKFAAIQEWISSADIAICALEVPIAPPGEAPSNYPLFGAPKELISSLAEVGWDGCAIATNHTMDRGFAGLEETINQLEAHGMGWHGGARTEDEAAEAQFYVLEVGDRQVNVAHLSATTLTNGLVHPAGMPWAWYVVGQLGFLDTSDIIVDAQKARENGADLVVVSMHWGTEYTSAPIEEQILITNELAESGAVDLVFGNHSHTPQPVEKVAGGPDGDGMWVVYSMGNMISGQTIRNHGYRVTTGVMATATVEVPESGPVRVDKLDWTIVTQDSQGTNNLYLLNDVVSGGIPADATTLTQEGVNGRVEATYPVMNADGSVERIDAPQSVATSLKVERR